MSKASKKKTTQSSRRHAFSSFRERIDSIKIDPHLNLNKRAHDYVESSHFLATLEHWKEVNISGNFTEFLDKVEPYSQTLPQILHHQSAIFESLHAHIEINDINSIQPLLELLSQFIHDLGPDFMPYYSKSLVLLTNLALSTNPNDSQNNRNSSNVLEWSFNCLAFAFKYLSKTLCADLFPTFEVLLPLLSLTKKTYISRFCAEALSFLVRKSKVDSLASIIDFCFNKHKDLIHENESYNESLIVLFSEAMKNTQGTFHSKSTVILSKLIENSLSEGSSESKFISIISDILLDVLNHGSIESCNRFYTLVTDYLVQTLDTTNNTSSLISVSQILVTLAFADSGRKITSWSSILSTINLLVEKIESIDLIQNEMSDCLIESLMYLFVIIIRNCDIQDLTKYHKRFFEAALNLNDGKQFLCFAEANLEISKSKMISFGIGKYIQEFINKISEKEFETKKLAFFFARLSEKEFYRIQPLILPPKIQDKIVYELIENFKEIKNVEQLPEMYWRLLILKNCQDSRNTEYEYLINLLEQLCSKDFGFDSRFSHDLAAAVVNSLSSLLKNSSNESYISRVFSIISSNFFRFQESSVFIDSVQNFFTSCSFALTLLIKDNFHELIYLISNNLSLPNHDSRYNSICLIIKIHQILNIEVPSFISQIRLIEEIPLTLNTGRDIALRVRNLTIEFKHKSSPSELERNIIVRFLFGLLSNKFQPCWTAVFEALPYLLDSCSSDIWKQAYHLIKMDFNSQNDEFYYLEDEMDDTYESLLMGWQARDNRIKDNFTYFDKNFFSEYQNITRSILEYARKLRADNTYGGMMRSQVIQALTVIPSVAEMHSDKLVSLVLKESDESDEEESVDAKCSSSWTLKDRNDLVGLFSKFRNLNKIYKSELFYQRMLELLCNKQTQVQKMALDVIFNYKTNTINKYKDNLNNLLDDTLFRDELSKFIIKGSDSSIEEQDLVELMPLVLRILFGRAQGSPKSNSKAGRKIAVINVLPNLPDDDIIAFLELGSDRIGYHDFFINNKMKEINFQILRKVSGFVNLLNEVYSTLGYKYNEVLTTTIKPLIYSLVVAQTKITEGETDSNSNAEKSAKNIRQVGMKCLNELFKLLGESFSWDDYIPIIYESIIRPRLAKFADENLQQTSSLMKIMINWIEYPNTTKFLYTDEFASTRAIVSIISNDNAKESVVSSVLDFSLAALTRKAIKDDDFFILLAMLVDTLLRCLPTIIDKTIDRDVNSKAIKILLLLLENNYIHENSTRASLLQSLTRALDKPHSQVDSKDKVNILSSLAAIIDDYECSFEDIVSVYQSCSKAFKIYPDRRIRETLVTVFQSIGNRFIDIEPIAQLLKGLNSYSGKRMDEPDFGSRLDSYKKINEELYPSFNTIQWLPIIYCALFFINDDLELAIRTNATFTLNRFIDCFSEKENYESAQSYIHTFKDVVLPNLRIGLRKSNESVQTEYINVLSHTIEHSKYFTELDDMKVLLFNNDDEANFFKNINHIQLHRRQRAIKRVGEYRNKLSENSISHYILPIIEHYAICTDEKLRNIANETIETISNLIRCISWNQFKALFRRYIANLKNSKVDFLKDHVNMVIAISKSLMVSIHSRTNNNFEDIIKNLPSNPEEINNYVIHELLPPLLKILIVRNDETIVARAPLSEALTCLVMCISEELIESHLPGILTSTCQVMRSRSEELRDAVRKTLSKIATLLGSKYFRFILQELKTALSRGSQIHVLSYTVHYLLASVADSSGHGDLDDSANLIVEVIMEDIFGAAGQEKDAEGYHSKMKEVKFKKSFSTGEILSGNISLKSFSFLIDPIKLLLKENVSLKTQNKLDELLKRYALGLNHNTESSTRGILMLSYELHQQASDFFQSGNKRQMPINESEDHFLVKLNAKPLKTQVEFSQYRFTLQKFAFELLRTAISRHESLITVPNLEGFIPLLEGGLKSDNEGVIIACLRVLILIIRLPFSKEADATFKACARRSLNIVKDCPTTNSELCQVCLKFLATVIRHKPDINLKHTAISYILVRIQPDLEEPNRQGLAFYFLKAVVSQHIMIPEVYDTMDKVSKIMVVNHAKEIRDMSRSVYFQFLMEYDQGRGKLEKQFKFLVNNLGYSTQAGRQSVMELIHLIISKSGPELLIKLASSFFVALANVAISDDAAKCREMATTLIANIFRKLGSKNMSNIEKYCFAWLKQTSNQLLKRCGYNIYKIYITEFGFGENKSLDDLVIQNIEETLLTSKNDDDSDTETQWELVYSSLNVFSAICNTLRESTFKHLYEKIWRLIVECLLFPHSWVRLITCRLVGILLSNLDTVEFKLTEYDVQTIAYRLLHQLGAPSVSQDLGTQIIKNLVLITMKWESNQTLYQYKSSYEVDSEESIKYKYATDYLVSRACAVMRQENNYKDSFISKKSSIQLCAMLIQTLSIERLPSAAEKILLALYNFTELDANGNEQEAELVNLSFECMQILEEKLGVSEYTKIYTKVKQAVNLRRQERKTKRAQLAVIAPEIAAKRKMKKHERTRERRKHEKDDNGYYRSKKRRFNN